MTTFQVDGASIDPSDIELNLDDIEDLPEYRPTQSRESNAIPAPPVPTYPQPQFYETADQARANRLDFLVKIFNFVRSKFNYTILFWTLIAPGTALVLFSLMVINNRPPQMQELDTPLSESSQNQSLETSVAIVLDQPIVASNGTSRPAVVSEVLEASKQVMNWQEDELLQKKANELLLAITLGVGNPTHICYQKSLEGCLDILQAGNDVDRMAALQVGDTTTVMTLDAMNRVFDRIREGNTRANRYQPDLYQVGRTKFLWAKRQLQQASPEGQASLLLMQQQMSQGASGGVLYDPQTGQMKPAQ